MMRCEQLRRARDTTRARAACLLAVALAVAIIFTTGGSAYAATSPKVELKQTTAWTNTGKPSEYGYVISGVTDPYSAAIVAIGRWNTFDDLGANRIKLVNASTGGRFYDLAQEFRTYMDGTEIQESWPTWASTEDYGTALYIMYGAKRIWTGSAPTGLIRTATEDYDTILNGGDLGSNDDTINLTVYPNSRNNFMSIESNSTKYNEGLNAIEVNANAENATVIKDKWFLCLYYSRGDITNLGLWVFPNDADITVEEDVSTSSGYKFRITNNGDASVRYQEMRQGYNVDSYEDGKLVLDITGYGQSHVTSKTLGAGSSVALPGGSPQNALAVGHSGSANTPSEPTNPYPDPEPDPEPEPPEVPAPTTPVDPDPYPDPPQNPIIPNPDPDPDPPVTTPTPTPSSDPVAPTEWTDYVPWLRAILSQLAVIHSDMMTGINSVIAGINNLSTMISRVITALNDHCAHIRNTITQTVDSVNDTNTYLWRYVWGEGGRFSYYQDNLMRYLQQLFEWLADQFDFTFDYDGPAAYDDSSVISWLKKIWAKLGGGTINTEPKDPVSNNDDWWQWLRDAVDGFFGGLVDILEDLGSGLGTFGDFLRHTFPFSIPWDLALLLGMLVAEPVTPSLTLTIPAIDGWWDSFDFVLDLEPYDDMMEIIRQMELYCFVFYLAQRTPELLRDVDVAGWLKGGE